MKKAPKLKKLPEEVTEKHGKHTEKYDNRPTFRISEKNLPEIKKWPIGNKYKLTIEVEMTGIGKEDYGAEKGNIVASLKVTKIAAI